MPGTLELTLASLFASFGCSAINSTWSLPFTSNLIYFGTLHPCFLMVTSSTFMPRPPKFNRSRKDSPIGSWERSPAKPGYPAGGLDMSFVTSLAVVGCFLTGVGLVELSSSFGTFLTAAGFDSAFFSSSCSFFGGACVVVTDLTLVVGVVLTVTCFSWA